MILFLIFNLVAKKDFFRIYFIMNRNEEILKTIKAENYIWILYLVLIGISFLANNQEVKYYLYNDLDAKKKYRALNILVFSVALLVYIYFFNGSYKSVVNLGETDSYNKNFFENINFIATTLVVIAGCIFLFIAIFDIDLETEVAFN